MKYILLLIVVISIFISAILLASENHQPITFYYLFGKHELLFSHFSLFVFWIGFLLGAVMNGFLWLRSVVRGLQMKRELKILRHSTEESLHS